MTERLSAPRMIKALIGILLFALATVALAKLPNPFLALDMRNAPHLPKAFRSTDDKINDAGKVNLAGLANLHMAGTAQFSELALQNIIKHLHVKKIMVIDLRQESHGFLNGNAVSWYGRQNATNAGMSPKAIEATQNQLLNSLADMKNATTYQIIAQSKDGDVTNTRPVEFAVHDVSSEAELVERKHLSYQRLYTQDHYAPDKKMVDKFIQVVKGIPANQWVLFHCRGGAGRTTSFMAMYDMMRNAKTVSFDDIIARQALMGGKDMLKLPAEDDYRYEPAVKRLEFLKKFYQYAHDNNDDYQTNWSTWLRMRD